MRSFLYLSLVIFASAGYATDRDTACEAGTTDRDFQRCAVCHTNTQDAGHLSGPNLWGIVGRRAGSAKGYTYSRAIADSGVIWGEDSLRQYLSQPNRFLPGNRMMMTPIQDPQELNRIICHLKSLSE